VRKRAEAKMCSRLGVRRAEIQALEISESARRAITKREFATLGLFNWHRPPTIDEARNEPRAKTVVDVHHGHV
jgi:hypothetical protein